MILIKLILFLTILFGLVFGLDKERDCKCKIDAQSRIVGGSNINQPLPFHASISYLPYTRNDTNRFGVEEKIIIENRHILTGVETIMTVGFGLDLVEIHLKGRYEVDKSFKHKFYNPKNDILKNDLAILRLKEPIDFAKESVSPACLDSNNYEKIKSKVKTLTTVGFGHEKVIVIDEKTGELVEPLKSSRFLKKTDLEDVSYKEIECVYDNSLLCLKSKTKGESVCDGDSGSPAFYTYDGKIFVLGTLISELTYESSTRCNGLGIYTRISKKIGWIKEIIGDEFCSD